MINSKNFKSKLSGAIRSINSAKVNLQELLQFGCEQYSEHGNANYLTDCVRACVGANALRTSTMKDYIVNATNLTWAKAKDGKPAFKKPKGEDATVDWAAIDATPWYGFDDNGNATKPDLDYVAQSKALISRILKSIENDKVKGGDIEGAQVMAAALEAGLNAALELNDKAA